MKTIVVDECGFSGADLMNEDQPIFVVASHDFSREEAAALKQEFFKGFQGPELKHKRLGGRKSGQDMVVAFLRKLAQSPERFVLGMAHKRFCVVLKMVDLLVEVMMHADGLDLYKDGGNVAMGNLWYQLFELDRAWANQLYLTFQAFIRAPSNESFRRLDGLLARGHAVDFVEEEVEHLRIALHRVDAEYLRGLSGDYLDVAAAVAFPLMHRWKERIGPGFSVLHDESSNMTRSKWMWDILVADDAPPATVGGGGWSVTYPIGITRTEFGSSKAHVELEIADVLAGAAARWAARTSEGMVDEDPYSQELATAFFAPLMEAATKHEGPGSSPRSSVASFIWPSMDVSRRKTPAGALDAIDYTTNLLVSRRGRR